MTREEAKKEFFTLLESGIIDFKEKNIIDKIYDSFEKRSCDNCKFGMIYLFDDEIECVKIEAETQGTYFSKDFSCNKWEKNES